LPVQLVNRPTPDFRGYSGLIASGDVYTGMPVSILPSRQSSHIDRIVASGRDVDSACAGQSVTVTLADEVDASRGDVIVDAAQPSTVTDRFSARIVWMGKDALQVDHHYLIKIGTCTASAKVENGLQVIDLGTQEERAVGRLFINDIGRCVVRLDRQVS